MGTCSQWTNTMKPNGTAISDLLQMRFTTTIVAASPQLHVLGLDTYAKARSLESVSAGSDDWLQGRAKRTRRGARHNSSRRWLGFSESKNLTSQSHQSKQINDTSSTISAQKPSFDLHERYLFATWLSSEARNRIRIRKIQRIRYES